MIRDRKQIRKWRTAKKVRGVGERPRLSVAITLKNIYAQIIDDSGGKTLAFVSTLGKDFRFMDHRDNTTAARAVGSALAKAALAKGLSQVVFDRGSRRYHGRIQALAEAAREGGLKF